ncbi:MAG: glycosyltransferase [Firmicutes bacterium]|nr:glycosyltransferase [Bacillota bacterium]
MPGMVIGTGDEADNWGLSEMGQIPGIELRGLVYEIDGYAECVRNILAGFREMGVAVALRSEHIAHQKVRLSPEMQRIISEAEKTPSRPEYPVIQFRLANAFQPEPGRYVIGISMLESDRINESWVAGCNRIQEVWVPTKFNWETFTRSGAKNVVVMPLGVDVERFKPGLGPPLQFPFARSFKFLAMDWFLRKGPDLVVHAYFRGFRKSDDVLLVYKVKPEQKEAAFADIHKIAANYGGIENTPPIAVMDTVYAWDEIPHLYNSVDCFLLPTRGEGWSLPVVEAMASGLPVICTNWSGPTQFINDQNAFPLRIEGLEPIPNFAFNEVCWQNGQWAKPSLEHLVELMRYTYENREEARKRGQKARSDVVKDYSWQKVTERMNNRIRQIVGA